MELKMGIAAEINAIRSEGESAEMLKLRLFINRCLIIRQNK